jgi:hypothetical protein
MAHHRFAPPRRAAPRALVSRRSFLGFVIAAPTLVVAAEMTTGFLGLPRPEYFPINHRDPFPFEPKPVVPPIPQSPTDGLQFTF